MTGETFVAFGVLLAIFGLMAWGTRNYSVSVVSVQGGMLLAGVGMFLLFNFVHTWAFSWYSAFILGWMIAACLLAFVMKRQILDFSYAKSKFFGLHLTLLITSMFLQPLSLWIFA